MKPNVDLLETTRFFNDEQPIHRNEQVASGNAVWALLHRHIGKAVIFGVALLILPGIVSAATTNLANHTQRTLKVCVYKVGDKTMLLPRQCWTIRPKQSVNWNRAEDPSVAFHVKVFQPGPVDRMVCSQTYISTLSLILLGE